MSSQATDIKIFQDEVTLTVNAWVPERNDARSNDMTDGI